MPKILLIGPLPPPMGGNTRHFETLFRDLVSAEGFSVELVNTSRKQGFKNPAANLFVALKTLWQVALSVRKVDVVSFHASDRGMLFFAPFIVPLCRLARKPVVLRLFGGSFGDFYDSKGRLGQWVIQRFVLSADRVLLQTKRMIRQLERHASGRLEWFSTYVQTAGRAEPARHGVGKSCERFVFMGHVAHKKGVDVMLDAAGSLPDDVSIDIYGPLDDFSEAEIVERGLGRIRYRGFLSHSEIDATLWDYDCLVLPTFYPGEGYPGVIAEAYAHDLPVVTTKWMAIPEIVDSECGILIEPQNTEEFVDAISALYRDRSLWQKLREGARRKAAQFDHAIWSRKFEEICEELA